MRVLHIINGLSDGGAESILYQLCLSDKKNKHIVISLMDAGKYGLLLNDIGVNLHCLNFQTMKIKPLVFLKLLKLIKEIKPDVVQTWMPKSHFIGGLAARLAGIKNIIWSIHYTILSTPTTKLSTVFFSKINIFLSYLVPKKIIYCAERSKYVLESSGFKKHPGVVVQNGYDTEKFSPKNTLKLSLRDELNIPCNTFIIGYVGRNHPDKDLPNLIKALSLIDQKLINFHAVLVGVDLDDNNVDIKYLLSENQLKSNVTLIGQRKDIPAIMNGIDLLVLSSNFEAFPNVLNEAMACGCPCISTDVGDAAIIIGNTGWIVPVKNSQALADKIILAGEEQQSNTIDWQKRKNDARQRIINNFDIKKMVKKYSEVWADCD